MQNIRLSIICCLFILLVVLTFKQNTNVVSGHNKFLEEERSTYIGISCDELVVQLESSRCCGFCKAYLNDIHVVEVELPFADKMVNVHSSCISGGFGLIVDFENCNLGDTIYTEEEALARLRIRSVPLQDGDCFHIEEGEHILAMHKTPLRSLFFDAEVEKVYFVPLNMYSC